MPEQKANNPAPINPAPLGLFGFGLTTVVLSCVNAGLLPHDAITVIVPLAFAYGGVAQIITGVLEFKNGNLFGTVAFTSYGLFWWWWAFLNWSIGSGILKPPAAPTAAAVTLLMWGIFTGLLWIVSFRLTKAVCSIFFLLTVTFFLLAAGDFGMGASFSQMGGYVGLATGADAVLVAFLELLNGVANKEVVPLGEPFIK